ncbi:PAS domain-containing sensor histidine kinase [Hymenobacter latericus]|uniref:PAS domain-containing sensor histidine kinase n=1 Tax=Hymenobacter sp. YIM 151858-1 TaxID=2987688 RepID=UPI002226B2E7|nr:PAS domain-containing sensor histidine kinase [Hymenobacter sp. YIM 151858-1]UYZ60854.1 PAS domain-containing sensor histidine kinase [Hymenobacter sp. YIM 151858-1]
MSKHPTSASTLAQSVLNVSLAPMALLRPAAPGTADFTVTHLNEAAQRVLQLPAEPNLPLSHCFAALGAQRVLAHCQAAYHSGQPQQALLPAGGAAPAWQLAVQCQHHELTLSFAPAEPAAPGAAAATDYRQLNNRLERLFRHAPTAICMMAGPDFVYQMVNTAYERLFPGRELLGKPLLEAVPEATNHEAYHSLQQVYRTGITHEAQGVLLPVQRTPGGPIENGYFNYIQQASFDEHGRTDGVVVFTYEVTGQVVAQQQMQQFQQELLTLTNAIDQLVWTAKPHGEVDYYNEQWYSYTGSSWQQCRNNGWTTYFHPHDLPRLQQHWHNSLAHGTPYEVEARLRAASGEYRWFLVRALPLRDADGNITRWFGTDTDIHEQKRLQQVLLESEEYFRSMADSLPSMIWVTDPDGQCTYLNRQWYSYTGQQEAEALGTGWLLAVHPNDAAAAEQAFLEANAHRVPFRVVYRLRRHDGQYRWAIDAGMPRYNAAGEYAGIVGTVFDIHERQLAEQALQRLTQQLRTARDEARALNKQLQATNERLVRTNVDLDNFIYSASHDLRVPITNIEGLLDLLEHQLPTAALSSPELAPVLHMMHDSVERFKRTIGYLSEVTKLQKEFDQPPAQVSLAAVFDDVRQDLQPLIEQTGAHLEADLGQCPSVSFSPRNLRSVVYNLLSNALKYRHPERPPHIRIACEVQEHFTVLHVHDNGLGLEPEQQQQLFTMFRRLHGHVEGSGVGLYMVKRSVENAGGRIQVSSEPGVGSRFSVYFPRPTSASPA